MLFTARTSVYSLRMTTPGNPLPQGVGPAYHLVISAKAGIQKPCSRKTNARIRRNRYRSRRHGERRRVSPGPAAAGKVLGLEQYDIPNEMGSSHGVSRMIRLAYHEDPSYVPLLYRAYELWHQLENRVRREAAGHHRMRPRRRRSEANCWKARWETVTQHHLPYRILSGPEVNQEWPGFQLPEEAEMLYEQQGGFVLSERCIVGHVSAALEIGAEVHGREAAVSWEPTAGGGVVVTTDKDTYSARRRLVVTAGAWAGKVAPEVAAHAVPERQVLGWVCALSPGAFPAGEFPVLRHGG